MALQVYRMGWTAEVMLFSLTMLMTKERCERIALFSMPAYGEKKHLHMHNEPPAFAARFCDCYEDETRYD